MDFVLAASVDEIPFSQVWLGGGVRQDHRRGDRGGGARTEFPNWFSPSFPTWGGLPFLPESWLEHGLFLETKLNTSSFRTFFFDETMDYGRKS